jgi:hypothetical protein
MEVPNNLEILISLVQVQFLDILFNIWHILFYVIN